MKMTQVGTNLIRLIGLLAKLTKYLLVTLT